MGLVVGILVLAAAGGAAALVLLGGGPSTAEYIADADQVCTETNGEVSRVDRIGTYPDLASAGASMAAGMNAQLGELSEVTTPSGSGGEQAAGVMMAYQGAARAADELAGVAGSADDAATIEATHRFGGAFNEARDAAVELGMESCVVGLQGGADAVFAGAGTVVKVGYLTEGEAICQAAARAAFELPEPYDFADFVALLQTAHRIDQGMVADLADLPVPPGDEQVVAEMVDSMNRTLASSGALIDAIAAEDIARADALALEASRLVTATNARLDDYGLVACGSHYGLL